MKNVVQDLTSAGIDWQREKWQSGLGSKFIHQGEKNAAKYADEVIVLSKGVQDYFKETYGRETHFIEKNYKPNEPIFLAELNIPDMKAVSVRQKIKKLTEDGRLKRFDTGIYYISIHLT